MAVLYTLTPPVEAPSDPGNKRARKPKVLMAEFGDGWSQRAAQGLNNNPLQREMSWTNITKADKDALCDFFEARNGVESFYYQHYDETAPKVYLCTEWDDTDVAFDVYTVTAKFQQVYDI